MVQVDQWDRHGVIRGMLAPVQLPKMTAVRQLFDRDRVADIPAAVAGELAKERIAGAIVPGMRVAVTVGSRGIANIALVIREIVRNLKRLGAQPFIVPAMGSHGGATASGQVELIESYGVTEERIGAPIRATMETVVIGESKSGHPVHLDRFAAEADGIVVVGRVKPHTAFHGEYESGLMKMMAIGLGKQKGAEICHADGFGRMEERVRDFGSVVLARARILFGVAIVENAYDETALIEAIPRAEIISREPVLLAQARGLMPRIFCQDFDVLVVDRIGKNFSGDGADPNITGTYCTPFASGGPTFQRYVVLDISDETHGNSLGVGMADFTTRRLFEKTDFDASYPNALTSRVVKHVKMPMVLENDRLALQAALFTCVDLPPSGPRLVRIPNTLHLELIQISEALLPAAGADPRVEILEGPRELSFDEGGALEPIRLNGQ